MGRINKTNKANPVSADEFIIYDSQDTTDDKNITLGQIASFTENQNSSIAGTKIFQNGVELQKGSIAFGQYSPLPTGIGSYIAQYTHPTYGTRLLGYNGSAYQDLNIGSMPTAGTFSIKSLANGDCNFGYNVNVTGTCSANKFYGDGSELDGIVSGVSIFDNKGTITTNITLAENKITTGYWSGTNTITLPTITDTTKQVTCILDFTTATSSQPTITNSNLKWSDKNSGKAPSSYSIISGVHNILIFKSIWESSTLYWEAEYTRFGVDEIDLVQPVLTQNGTLGSITNVAVFNSTAGANAYWLLDGNTSSNGGTDHGVPIIISFPKPTKISSFRMIFGTYYPYYATWYGSNDNSTYVPIATISGNSSADLIVGVSTQNQGYYRYYKYISTSGVGTQGGGILELYLTGRQINQNYTS